jgi:2-polyprenyl-3-methyl-5-hydroxy-6-metoxy-1,4-benzoquinol methylase
MEDALTSSDPLENYERILRLETEFPNATVDAERLRSNLSELRCGKRFLDVGAGYGFFSRAALASGFEVTALEVNDKSRQVFELMNGFAARDLFFDQSFSEKNRGKFDIILLSQVLEHLRMESDPISTLRDCLAVDGICVIAVPRFRSTISILQGKRDMFITPPEHLNFFTVVGLKRLFEGNGFRTLKMETISKFNRAKFGKKIGIRLGAFMAETAVSAVLKVSDLFDRGMFINGYFQKLR